MDVCRIFHNLKLDRMGKGRGLSIKNIINTNLYHAETFISAQVTPRSKGAFNKIYTDAIFLPAFIGLNALFSSRLVCSWASSGNFCVGICIRLVCSWASRGDSCVWICGRFVCTWACCTRASYPACAITPTTQCTKEILAFDC